MALALTSINPDVLSENTRPAGEEENMPVAPPVLLAEGSVPV